MTDDGWATGTALAQSTARSKKRRLDAIPTNLKKPPVQAPHRSCDMTMQRRGWMVALVACCMVAVANAGVTIDKIKEGDGVNFPKVGKSIKVRSRASCGGGQQGLCLVAPRPLGPAPASCSRAYIALICIPAILITTSHCAEFKQVKWKKDAAEGGWTEAELPRQNCAISHTCDLPTFDTLRWSRIRNRCITRGSCWRREPSSTLQRSGARRLFSPLVSDDVLYCIHWT